MHLRPLNKEPRRLFTAQSQKRWKVLAANIWQIAPLKSPQKALRMMMQPGSCGLEAGWIREVKQFSSCLLPWNSLRTLPSCLMCNLLFLGIETEYRHTCTLLEDAILPYLHQFNSKLQHPQATPWAFELLNIGLFKFPSFRPKLHSNGLPKFQVFPL